MNKIFFDTNILIDILIPSRPNHSKAKAVYVSVCDTFDTLTTSENIITTIEYIATKNGTNCRVIHQFFEGLRSNFELYGFGEILERSLEIYGNTCHKGEKIDFEDLLQIECALYHQCDVFLTEDKEIKKLDTRLKVICLDEVLLIQNSHLNAFR